LLGLLLPPPPPPPPLLSLSLCLSLSLSRSLQAQREKGGGRERATRRDGDRILRRPVQNMPTEAAALTAAGFRPKKRTSPYFVGDASRPASPADSPAEVAGRELPAADTAAAEEAMGSPEYWSMPKKRQKGQRATIVVSSDSDEADDDGVEQQSERASASSDHFDGDALLDEDIGFAQPASASASASVDGGLSEKEKEEQLVAEAIKRSLDSSQDADAEICAREREELERAIQRSKRTSGPYETETDTERDSEESGGFYNPKERPKERLPQSDGRAAARGFRSNTQRSETKAIPVGRRSRVQTERDKPARAESKAI
jgi:hypothetical protein